MISSARAMRSDEYCMPRSSGLLLEDLQNWEGVESVLNFTCNE